MIERFAALMRARPAWVVIATALVTLFFLVMLPRLEVYNASEKYELPASDPARRDFEQFRARFNEGDAIVVGIDFHRGIGEDDRRAVAGLIARLEESSLIRRIGSPVAVPAPVATVVGLLSKDGHKAAIVVEPETHGLASKEAAVVARRVAADVRTAARRHLPADVDVHFAGLALIDEAFELSLKQDLRVFGALSAAFTLAILLLLFRSWIPVALSAIVALTAVIWSLGLISVTGTPFSLGLSMVVPLATVSAVAYSVHYLSTIYRPDSGDGGDGAITEMVRSVAPPSVLTALTTIGGFLSLNTSRLAGVREVGTFLALAILACFFLTSVFLPSLLFLLPNRLLRPRGGRLAARLVLAAGTLGLSRPRTILVAYGLVAAIALAGAARLTVDTNHLLYLPEEHGVRAAYRFVDQEFGGVIPIEVLVTRDPAAIEDTPARLVELGARIRRLNGIGAAISPMDVVGPFMAVGLGSGHGISWAHFAQTQTGSNFVHSADSVLTFRLAIRAAVQGTRGLSELLDEIGNHVAGVFPAAEVTVTGMAPVFVRTVDYLVGSQVSSLAVGFAVVLATFTLLARSWRIGSLAVLVNTLPVLMILGVMGWLGIPIDMSTVMIGSVLIGIAADDTIHFLHCYLARIRRRETVRDAALGAMSDVGGALMTSTLVLSGGFLIMAASSLATTSRFGLLSAITLSTALLADLMLLPALLIRYHRVR
ncbi:MAG: efflux RND transporter permease subunit [Longimicrobiales bacterium]